MKFNFYPKISKKKREKFQKFLNFQKKILQNVIFLFKLNFKNFRNFRKNEFQKNPDFFWGETPKTVENKKKTSRKNVQRSIKNTVSDCISNI